MSFDEFYIGYIILIIKPVEFPSTEVYVLRECGIHTCGQEEPKFAWYVTNNYFVLKYNRCSSDLVLFGLLQTCSEHSTDHRLGKSESTCLFHK